MLWIEYSICRDVFLRTRTGGVPQSPTQRLTCSSRVGCRKELDYFWMAPVEEIAVEGNLVKSLE